MKIGVLSDTHSQQLPRQMLNDFKKVDLIIHAGDFCTKDVLKALAGIKEVKGVYGNMDEPDLRRLLPRRQIVQCASFQVGVFHGEGAAKFILDSVRREFKGIPVDAIIFGHSHQVMNEVIDDVLYFNPGSPTDVVAPFRSYGILEVGKTISGKIIKVPR